MFYFPVPLWRARDFPPTTPPPQRTLFIFCVELPWSAGSSVFFDKDLHNRKQQIVIGEEKEGPFCRYGVFVVFESVLRVPSNKLYWRCCCWLTKLGKPPNMDRWYSSSRTPTQLHSKKTHGCITCGQICCQENYVNLHVFVCNCRWKNSTIQN